MIEQLLDSKDPGSVPQCRFNNAFSEDPTHAWRRPSLGVNLIVRLPQSKQIILAVRGELAAYNNAGKYYPSVTEGVKQIDIDSSEEENSNFIINCIVRGLSEEMGIDAHRDYNPKTDIRMVSAFFSHKYNQDNLFAVVTLPKITSQALSLFIKSAPDSSIENIDVIYVSDTKEDLVQFMIQNDEKMIDFTRYCLFEYIKRHGTFTK